MNDSEMPVSNVCGILESGMETKVDTSQDMIPNAQVNRVTSPHNTQPHDTLPHVPFDPAFDNTWRNRTTTHTPYISEDFIPYVIYGTHTHTNRVLPDNCQSNGQSKGKDDSLYGCAFNGTQGPNYLSNIDFVHTMQNLKLQLNERAVQRLNTTIKIPGEVKFILAFGPKFSVPLPLTESRQKLLLHGIHKLNKFHLSVYEQRTLSAMTKEHILKTKSSDMKRSSNYLQQFIIHCYNCTLKFFSDNGDHIIAMADKGNITIVMQKNDYVEKVEAHLSDTATYQRLNVSSHIGYGKRNEFFLKKLAELNIISRNAIPAIVATETQIPNMYGLIKMHKEEKPIRPVVNTRSAPGYTIARMLTKLLTPVQETHKYNVRNSIDVIERLRYLSPDPDEIFATFDIASMYTNIDIDMAISAIMKRHAQNKIRTNIPIELLIDMVRFVIKFATEIEFNGLIYKQVRGLKMGACLSSILSDIVIEDLLDNVFIKIQRPKFFSKYVDDCLTLAHRAHIEQINLALNGASEQLQFVMEKEDDGGTITYLDIKIKNTHNYELRTEWYQKPFASGRFLNYLSAHPRPTIINTAKCYIFNMFALTHPSKHGIINAKAVKLLMCNNYPQRLCKGIIDDACQKYCGLSGSQCGYDGCVDLFGDTIFLDPNDPYQFKQTTKMQNIYAAVPHLPEITPFVRTEIHLMRPDIIAIGTPMATMKRKYDQHKNLRNVEERGPVYVIPPKRRKIHKR